MTDCHHRHSHQHHHLDAAASRNIGMAFSLNLGFALIELVGGIYTGSYAILADALHDLGDSLSLAVAYLLQKASLRKPDSRFTFGYGRLSLLASIISGTIIFTGAALVLATAIPRFWRPGTPHAPGMVALAVFGFLVNGFAFWKLSRGLSHNEKILKWHLFEDAFSWLIVLIGGLSIWAFGWNWVDPLLATGLALFIMLNIVKGLREPIGLFLQEVPQTSSIEDLRDAIQTVPGVKECHDLHVWSLDGNRHILTVHVETTEATDSALVKENIREVLAAMGTFHCTIEIEYGDSSCQDKC